MFRLLKPIYLFFNILLLFPSLPVSRVLVWVRTWVKTCHSVKLKWGSKQWRNKNYNLQTGDDLASLLCDRGLNRFELAAFACNTFYFNFYIFVLCFGSTFENRFFWQLEAHTYTRVYPSIHSYNGQWALFSFLIDVWLLRTSWFE